ncbi:hypothetical protein [uncultured Lutibacter sp.]|uniref:hypothetical protein n=1 Tax=uncultured Lutibacter sp. TaxID=437739 RepID=UPI002610BFA1|nr:hypothetical protein [uncultured Lutibacter sp.]
MRVFEDYETNQRAIKIISGIETISATIGLMMGVETDINEDITSEIKNMIMERPVILAQDIMEINEKSLYKIQNVVGCSNNIYKQLSDSTAICIIGVLNFPINEARLTLKNPEVENSHRGTKLRMWMHESSKILVYLKKHYYLSDNVKIQIEQSLDMLNKVYYN